MYLQRHGQLVGLAHTPRTAFDRPSARGRLRRRATAVPARAAVGRWQQRRYACRSASQGPPRSSCCNHRLVVAESPTCPPGHHGGEKRRRRSRHGGAGDRPATPPVKPPRLPPDHGAASRGRPTPHCCKSCPRPMAALCESRPPGLLPCRLCGETGRESASGDSERECCVGEI